MKLLRYPTIRQLISRSHQQNHSSTSSYSATSSLRPHNQQRRWARVQDVRFNDIRYLSTNAAGERVFDKYREKLARKAKDEGLKDVDSLREAYKAKIETVKKDAAVEGDKKTKTIEAQDIQQDARHTPFVPPPAPEPHTANANANASKVAAAAASAASGDAPGVKTLSSFLDVEKTSALPPKEIEVLWRLRHASNAQSLAAVIPQETYAHIALAARKYPQFVLPVPREGQGAEIHFLQWTFPAAHTATVLFTQLAEYKLRGEFASPHTTVTMHSELLQDKGVVLAQGQVVEGRGVSVEDGKWLMMCLQKFYGTQADEVPVRRALMEQFSSGDPGFDIQKLLDEAEKIG